VAVLQDYWVNNLPARDALPTPKMFAITIKFFINHYSITWIGPPIRLPGFIVCHPLTPFFKVGYSLPVVDSSFQEKVVNDEKSNECARTRWGY
jgi:hypothetical protein